MSANGGRFRVLDHTADLRLQLEGQTFADLVGAGCAALRDTVLGDGDPPAGADVRSVAVRPTEASPESALVQILNEALFQLTVRGLVVRAYEGDPTGGLLQCVELAEGVAPIREVKAVTYDRVVCRRLSDGSWSGEITLDL